MRTQLLRKPFTVTPRPTCFVNTRLTHIANGSPHTDFAHGLPLLSRNKCDRGMFSRLVLISRATSVGMTSSY